MSTPIEKFVKICIFVLIAIVSIAITSAMIVPGDILPIPQAPPLPNAPAFSDRDIQANQQIPIIQPDTVPFQKIAEQTVQEHEAEAASRELQRNYEELGNLNDISMIKYHNAEEIGKLKALAEDLYTKATEHYDTGEYKESIIYTHLSLEVVHAIHELMRGV